jgi:hypothetical protein
MRSLAGCQQLRHLPAADELLHDVRTSHKLPVDVQLGDGGPLAVRLDGVTQAGVVELVQNVDNLGEGGAGRGGLASSTSSRTTSST